MFSCIFHDGSFHWCSTLVFRFCSVLIGFLHEILQPEVKLQPNHAELYLCFKKEIPWTSWIFPQPLLPHTLLTEEWRTVVGSSECEMWIFVTVGQGGSIKSTVVCQLDFQRVLKYTSKMFFSPYIIFLNRQSGKSPQCRKTERILPEADLISAKKEKISHVSWSNLKQPRVYRVHINVFCVCVNPARKAIQFAPGLRAKVAMIVT